MGNTESAIAKLRQLKERGIGLSMDDFGTGYSSLSYLHKFSFDVLKIDRSFVSRIGPDGENSEIVETIVSLAHNLGMRVVAEGVETARAGRAAAGPELPVRPGLPLLPAGRPREGRGDDRRGDDPRPLRRAVRPGAVIPPSSAAPPGGPRG